MDRWRFAPRLDAVYGAQCVAAGRDVRTTERRAATCATRRATTTFNPRVGRDPSLSEQLELFTNLSRIYEAPTTYELADDVRGSDTTLEAMHGERARSRDCAATREGGTRWHWDLAVYYARARRDPLARRSGRPGHQPVHQHRQDIHAGIEALVGISFALGGSGIASSRWST